MRRKLEELNLLDDFLFQEVISRGEKGEEVCRIILSTILGRKIRQVKVTPQKPFLGLDTERHGIRLDAYLEVKEESADAEVESDIYDIEPQKTGRKQMLPRRTRYYQGMIDAKLLMAGKDYTKLRNVCIIVVLPYDPFDKNRMVYTIKSQCIEDKGVVYEDGITKIYLYTKGINGNPSQELREMLQYMENSVMENVKNQELAVIHEYVENIRGDKEVGIQYMKSWEHDEMMREEGQEAAINLLNALNLKLIEAGRLEDIKKAATDKEYQQLLIQELGLKGTKE